MSLPEGKLPGYYAQIIKGIAAAAEPVDRAKELLFADDDDVDAVLSVLARYSVEHESGPWLLLDEPDWVRSRIWDDYAVDTRLGNGFLDLSLAAVVRLSPAGEDSELVQAGIQLEEICIAFRSDEAAGCAAAIDRQQLQLAEGISSAYRCTYTVLY